MLILQKADAKRTRNDGAIKKGIVDIVNGLPKIPEGETNELNMIKDRLRRRQPENDFTRELENRVAALDDVDKVFFTAYFSELYDEAAYLTNKIAWKVLLDAAEKETREGPRIYLFDAFGNSTLNQEMGKICEQTSPKFEIAFRFRNVVKMTANLPDAACFISMPLSENIFNENALGKQMEINSDLLKWLKITFARFSRHEKEFYRSDSESAWKAVHDIAGRNYVVKMNKETVDVYRCNEAQVYAKGTDVDFPLLWVDTGEFSLYSPKRNLFYQATMESGKITGACAVLRKPSEELDKLFNQIMQAEKKCG